MTKKLRLRAKANDISKSSTTSSQTKFVKQSVEDKKSQKKKKESKAIIIPAIEGNPYAEEVADLKKQTKYWENLVLQDEDEEVNKERNRVWDDIEEKSQQLCNKYAWAIPDDRSLSIISHFSPLVEIGAGQGYWSRLLQERGVDVLPYDKYVDDMTSLWSQVKTGDPSTLSKPSLKDRNLFLCYPDEQESMAATCLEHFQGEYIVHVGEMIFTGTLLAPPVAPFGRTSSADFQVSLAESFHCVLMARLSLTYPISSDCISVWKRTKYVKSRESSRPANPSTSEKVEKKSKSDVPPPAPTSSDISSAVEFMSVADLAKLREAALDLQYQEDEEGFWANIPPEEVLPVDRAAPQFSHLLK